MKLKSTFTLITIFLIGMISFAQTDKEIQDNSSLLDRVYVGGNVGFQFGDITNVQIAPIIGYRITNDFSAGVGFQYQYTKFKRTIPEFSSNNYGASIFARYRIKAPFFLQAEYEYLNREFIATPSLERLRGTISSFFVGGGNLNPLMLMQHLRYLSCIISLMMKLT